jgi:hypothetical protein
MNVKNILDIDAFSKGLMGVTGNSGIIIPMAVQDLLKTYASQAMNFPYASNVLEAFFLSWQFQTLVSHKS